MLLFSRVEMWNMCASKRSEGRCWTWGSLNVDAHFFCHLSQVDPLPHTIVLFSSQRLKVFTRYHWQHSTGYINPAMHYADMNLHEGPGRKSWSFVVVQIQRKKCFHDAPGLNTQFINTSVSCCHHIGAGFAEDFQTVLCFLLLLI